MTSKEDDSQLCYTLYMETPKEKLNLMESRIETPNLLLVPISMDYREDIFREFTKDIATHMFPQPAADISGTDAFINASLKDLASGKDLQLVILDKITGDFIGCGGLHSVNTSTPELGIWIKKSAHGRKLGREAIVSLKNWADKNISYDYLFYPVAPENIASRKIPESMGGKVFREYETTNLNGGKMTMVEYRIYKN